MKLAAFYILVGHNPPTAALTLERMENMSWGCYY